MVLCSWTSWRTNEWWMSWLLLDAKFGWGRRVKGVPTQNLQSEPDRRLDNISSSPSSLHCNVNSAQTEPSESPCNRVSNFSPQEFLGLVTVHSQKQVNVGSALNWIWVLNQSELPYFHKFMTITIEHVYIAPALLFEILLSRGLCHSIQLKHQWNILPSACYIPTDAPPMHLKIHGILAIYN